MNHYLPATAVLDAGELNRGVSTTAPPAISDPAIRASWRWLTWPIVVLGLLTVATLAGIGGLLAQGASADAHLQAVGRPVAAICYQSSRFSMPRVRYPAGAVRWNALAPFAGPWECVGDVPMTILADPADPFVVGTVDGESASGRDSRNFALILTAVAAGLGWGLAGRVRDTRRLHRLIGNFPAVPRRIERVARGSLVPRTTLVGFSPAPGAGPTRLVATVRRSRSHRIVEGLAPRALVQVVGGPGRYAALCLPGIRPVLLELPRTTDDGARLLAATRPDETTGAGPTS